MKSQTMRYLILAILLALTAGLMAQDYPATYKSIEKLNNEGKYRSALEATTKLYEQAEKAGDEDQMLKALAYRAAFTFQLEEDGYEAALKLLLEELAANKNRPAVAPVLHYLIGQGYYTFANNNRYRLRNATATTRDSLPTADTPLADWNLLQLSQAAEEHLLRGLELAREQRTRLSAIPAIVTGDEGLLKLRPSLYDLLARNSMNVLASPLIGINEPSPEETDYLLLPAPEFTQLDLSTLEEDHLGVYRKLRIYQDLLAYHLEEKGPALLLLDRERIAYARQLGAADSAYLAALAQMQNYYAGVSFSDLLLVDEASFYNRQDEKFGERPKAKALEILDGVKDKSPRVANAAVYLRREILTISLRATVQTVYGKSDNILVSLNYRNVDRVYHRLIRIPNGEGKEFNGYNFDKKQLTKWRKLPTVAKTNFRLPDNDDYNEHTTETWLKAQRAGSYYLLSSTGPKFDLDKETVAVTRLQVSNLAVMSFDDGDEQDYFKVLDRTTGAPRAGVSVTVREQINRRNNEWKTVNNYLTEAEGRFPKVANGRSRRVYYILEDRANDDRYVSNPEYLYNNRRENNRRIYPVTPLFTDRSIYRPGQTVQVYGITYQKLRDEMPELLTDTKRELTLYDANGQEVGKTEVSSDGFSRFSHPFKLPEGGLTGNFRIQTEGGSVRFKVEEYKRPRFQVELTPPDYAISGEMAVVDGKATLYAGPGVNDAKVNYRVFLEEVRYWWWGRGNNNERELVTSGETTTDDAGAFTLSFIPAAGLGKQRRRYRYVVEVDVADETGETHAAETGVSLRSSKPVVAIRPAKDVADVSDSLGIRASGTDEELEIAYRIVRVEKPDAALRERKWSFPDRPLLKEADYRKLFPELAATESQPLKDWQQVDRLFHSGTLRLSDGAGKDALSLSGFQAGHYRIEWTYPDGTAGEPSTFKVINTQTGRLPAGMLYHLTGLEGKVTVGQPITITLLSALDLPHVVYGWASRKGFQTEVAGGGKKTTFRYVPTEADRGGIQFNAAFLRLNKAHTLAHRFNLPWDNKKLQIDYATFRDKLRPGEPEKWTLTVKNADGTPVAAAALASMYDASLDQIYAGNRWQLSAFPGYYVYRNFANLLGGGSSMGYGNSLQRAESLPEVKALPELSLPFNWYSGRNRRYEAKTLARSAGAAPPAAYSLEAAPESEETSVDEETMVANDAPPPPPPPPGKPEADESNVNEPSVQIRKKLQETAFWLPELTSNAAGELIVSFDSPEALTSWNFRVLAHDKDFNTAVSTQAVKTQKELMVLPNVPRFVRESDEIELTTRVNNMTEQAMDVTVTLEFFDPTTNEVLTLGADAGAKERTKQQSLAATSGTSLSFPLSIPEGLSTDGPIGYRIIARGPGFSDGEENVIPVLTDRTLITVSQPFYLKRKEKKTITLPLLASNDSKTLQHVGYTFQATTNPAWLALKALPYLIEYPYDCTEQLANRYFANQLAFATVSRKPVLEEVFRRWQADTNALKSELERNPTLKNALLTETPWLRAAQSEAEQRARIANLFDLKKLADEQVAALEKLANRQSAEGYYSWFPGGRENRYMTQYVLETLGRMQQLGVVTPNQEARVSGITKSAVVWLDVELAEQYQRLQKQMKDEKDWRKNYRPSSTVVHYLYARKMSAADPATSKAAQDALAFYTERVAAGWTDYGLYEQALIASTFATPQQAARPVNAVAENIIESLRERAIRKDEFGMYWKYGRGYRWQNLPIETHCRILEAFRVNGATTEELDEMRLWLLTNKRTNRWPTTKSTAAAVYALLNTGSNWTKTDGKPLKVSWPRLASANLLSTRVRAAQASPEAATGAFSVAATAGEVSAEMASVQVKNRENELVWGGVYWQYTELAQKVEAGNDGPLTLDRELFHRIPTDDGMRLDPITADKPLKAGDRVTVRLILRSDRDLDFVHLKDRRAATFEPIEQLSGYQYKNGLGYYFTPGDLATNFFIDHLPRGTYTLEYDLFATYSGSFSNGLGRVQCMYAPEFGGNTGGARIVVE